MCTVTLGLILLYPCILVWMGNKNMSPVATLPFLPLYHRPPIFSRTELILLYLFLNFLLKCSNIALNFAVFFGWKFNFSIFGRFAKKVWACYSNMPLHSCALASGAQLVIVLCTATCRTDCHNTSGNIAPVSSCHHHRRTKGSGWRRKFLSSTANDPSVVTITRPLPHGK